MFVNFIMHRIILSILLTTSLFAKDIIAVLDLETIGLNPGEAQTLTQRLTSKLVSIGKYQVVERSNMDKILKEQKFQHSGCTDSECAVEIGQLLNTDFIIIGSVSKFGDTWALDARLIDVGKGNVLISAEYSKSGKMDVLLTSGITSIAKQLCEWEEIDDNVLPYKPRSINIGLGSQRSITFLSMSQNIKSWEDNTLFFSVGIGATIIGIGLSNKTLNLNGVIGLDGESFNSKSKSSNVTYFVSYTGQVNLGRNWLFDYGLGFGNYYNSSDDGKIGHTVFPILSFEYVF